MVLLSGSLRTVERAEIEGEKKYSPPRDSTKSVTRVVFLVGLVGSRPATKRCCPWFAPMIGSYPGWTDLLGKNLKRCQLSEYRKAKGQIRILT